uniref:SGNH hydrolase-type esterase domain-containing protein n=1 Tax=Araucaria cunninghamii TaxID=56994 RepID=A0A0D6QRY5_ARACU
MEERRWGKILIFCVVVLVFKAGLWRSRELYDQYVFGPRHSALFVFGDSLADAGNNNYLNTSIVARANFPPYGKSFFGTATGRFSDGRTVFDFLATRLEVPFPAPWFQPRVDWDISYGANFASAGSGLLNSTSQQYPNVVPFDRQVNEFTRIFYMLETESDYPAEKLLSSSIIAINIGANDIAGYFMANTSLRRNISPGEFIDSLLNDYKNHLLSLHEAGARKFVIMGISPLGCSPGMRFAGLSRWRGGCDQTVNEQFQQFNAGLKNLVLYLNKTLRVSTLIYVNTYDILMNIIHNGRFLGFSESASACCGEGPFNAAVGCGQTNLGHKRIEGSVCTDPRQYVFWDGFHPTERAQLMIADQIWGGDSSVFPFNLRTLTRVTAPPYVPSYTA